MSVYLSGIDIGSESTSNQPISGSELTTVKKGPPDPGCLEFPTSVDFSRRRAGFGLGTYARAALVTTPRVGSAVVTVGRVSIDSPMARMMRWS
jgi:hypothetical protein